MRAPPTAPKTTIAIISHSNRSYLLEAVGSVVRGEESRGETEIVVLDNASSDGSVNAVRAAYPDVTVIEQSYRAGFGANHNRIIRATEGAYVLLLNDDAKVAAGMVQMLVDFLESHPAAAAVGPKILGLHGKPLESAWQFPSLRVVALFALTAGRIRSAQCRGDRPRRVDQLSAGALLLRRSAIEQIGLFDEGFYMYAEDADLSLRLHKAGWEAWFVPDAVVHHVGGASSDGLKRARIVEEWRSRRRFWTKHYGQVTANACGFLRGLPYGVVGILVGVTQLLPGKRLEPLRERGRLLRWQVTNAWFGARGPGLREAAETWNADHARSTAEVT